MTTDDFLGPIGNASAKYDAGNAATRAMLRRFLREIDRAAARIGPASVLDVGCGEGVVTERFARLLGGATVLGVDADDKRLRDEWEKRGLHNLAFRTASAYELPFETGAFDLVCALEVLEHLERPRDALTEMARVGRRALLLSVPREPLWRISHLLAGRDLRSGGNTPGHINHWSKRNFRSLVAEYGRIASLGAPFPWTVAVVELDRR